MRPNKKSTKDPDREKPVSKRKKVEKPWRVEYMIVDAHQFEKHSWFRRKVDLNVWVVDEWGKYLSAEHAVRELNKLGRSYFNDNRITEHWRFAGRKFRLVNTLTAAVINLEIGEREVYVKED